ncbi:MAG: 23S rRNA (adenine(2503)-C(2))-methyltransferase RlmN [Propionibacteriaceae bacterium]|jgi:23S rRNA (adenine2503-C2)-methyltransferase|nr:23S rRNA (adenine(2503)-C(2))-methyltransferase RlmN [Propionibacteriaceae bacterium]
MVGPDEVIDELGAPVETGSTGRRVQRPPTHWADLDETGRRRGVEELGLAGFRANQVSRHYFERLEADPEQWTDLSAADRSGLRQFFPPLLTELVRRQADRGTTVKTLYRLFDSVLVESVTMRYLRSGRGQGLGGSSDEEPVGTSRSTLCVSSQAGCGIGCPFCATGQAGLTRNLTAAEIVEQVRLAMVTLASGDLNPGPGPLNNVVFMGMGEPLANYRAVMTAVRAICGPTPSGFGLSARGITVSTSGLVPRINDLANEKLPLTLAVSLHAPDDKLRDELVPLNRRWNLAQLLDAARSYFDVTGRRVSIEYAMMRDINDQGFRADLLAKQLLTRGRGWVHVNLIPLNPTPGSKWTASRRADEAEFIARLEAHRIPVTVRDTRGQDIDGACGQLAAAVGQSAQGGLDDARLSVAVAKTRPADETLVSCVASSFSDRQARSEPKPST